MKNWYDMTISEIKQITDLEIKKLYMYKYRIGLVNFVNPIYNSLTKKQQSEYDMFDPIDLVPMYQKIQKLKEIIGEENAKQIVHKRMSRVR